MNTVKIVKTGLQRLLEENSLFQKYHNLNLGMITNHTAIAENYEIGVDALLNKGYKIRKIFGPEHGFRGDVAAGESVSNYTDHRTGLPVISLYGNSKKLPIEEIDDLDGIIFDLQDIGARYYTFIYTMAYAMQSCAEANKKFIILDRPNPINGLNIEGTILDEKFSSFVGLYPIPNRHSLTIGELGKYFNKEFAINCDLKVIEMKNWQRAMLFNNTYLPWIMPSPNTTCIEMALLYSGTCLIEGTELSEGRGTTKPFEIIGAPWIDNWKWKSELDRYNLPGIVFRTVSFTPNTSKHSDDLCYGIQIHITDYPDTEFFKVGLILLETLKKCFPNNFTWLPPVKDRYFIDLLAGTDELRKTIDSGKSILDWYQIKKTELEKYKIKRQKYLLY